MLDFAHVCAEYRRIRAKVAIFFLIKMYLGHLGSLFSKKKRSKSGVFLRFQEENTFW